MWKFKAVLLAAQNILTFPKIFKLSLLFQSLFSPNKQKYPGLLVPGVLLALINQNNQNSNWKKNIGIQKYAGKNGKKIGCLRQIEQLFMKHCLNQVQSPCVSISRLENMLNKPLSRFQTLHKGVNDFMKVIFVHLFLLYFDLLKPIFLHLF